MARQVEEYGAGVVYEAGNFTSLIEACELAIATLPELREGSVAAAAGWCRVHNAANFVATLQGSIKNAGLAVAS